MYKNKLFSHRITSHKINSLPQTTYKHIIKVYKLLCRCSHMLCKEKKSESFCFTACFGQELADKGSKHDDYWCLEQAQEQNVALNTTDNVQCFQPCIICTTVITAIFEMYNSAHSPNSIKQLCSARGRSGQQVWSYKTAGDWCRTSQQLPAYGTPRKHNCCIRNLKLHLVCCLLRHHHTSMWYLKEIKPISCC